MYYIKTSIKIRICGTFWIANNPNFLRFPITPNLTKMSEIYSELLDLIWTLKKKLRTWNIFSAHDNIFFGITKNNTNSKLVSNFFPNVIKNKPDTPPIAFASYITPDGRTMMCFLFCTIKFWENKLVKKCEDTPAFNVQSNGLVVWISFVKLDWF